MLVVTDGTQHQAHKHEDSQEVALAGRLIVVHHIQQEVDEDWGHKLTGIVDQLERNGSTYEASGGLPTSICLQQNLLQSQEAEVHNDLHGYVLLLSILRNFQQP